MDDFATLQNDITSALVSSTRTTAALAATDIPFQRSLDPKAASALDKQNARLLALATRLLGAAAQDTESVRPPPSLKDVDAIDSNWRAVVDVVDSLLERADTALDEFTGAVKRWTPEAETQPSRFKTLHRHADIEKPQLLFEHVPTNDDAAPFRPLLQTKPHSATPLRTEPIAQDDGPAHFSHPYQSEIESYHYPVSLYTKSEPTPPLPFQGTSATFVDTEEALDEMLTELEQAKEIAIDLEHHDQRSYIGIVSLMQISTREKDWIVDTLQPWRRKLERLNQVFADPRIIKVLHGAYMDVVWLQRDLGLYLVGLFDTHFAARALGYPGGSLAFLLKKFVDVDAQKQYQIADWRIRPLPQELLDYARSDTHYLLYIFDCMRNELIQRSNFELPDHQGDKLWDVLQKSKETALQRYEHPIYDYALGQGQSGWYKMLSRTPALFSREQFSVFRAVHQWRDQVAREQDDSTQYIMPNHQVFSIAREMPRTRPSLLGVAQPVTQTVRLRADELVGIVVKAKEEGVDGPEMLEILNTVEPHNANGSVIRTPRAHAVVAQTNQSRIPSQSLTGSIRTAVSSFWGNVWKDANRPRQMSTMQLTMPMSTGHNPGTIEESTPEPISSMPPTPIKSEDEPIVLKNLNRKRKRLGVNDDGMAANNDEVSLAEVSSPSSSMTKSERRKARKEAKQAAKREEQVEADEAPFDYASAPSVLNQPAETREEMKKRRKKEINPYAKAMDTSKGLARTQREKAGKSATFKN